MIIHRDGWRYSGRVPEFFNGQAGCFCCPPPPPPEPSAAYYGGSSYNPIPECTCGGGTVRWPDALTITCVSGTCTCLVGKSWTIKRFTNYSHPFPELISPCSWVTERGAGECGGSGVGFGSIIQCPSVVLGATNLGTAATGCDSVQIAFHWFGNLCMEICTGSGGLARKSFYNSSGTFNSCSPLVWTSGTINLIGLFFSDTCGTGTGTSGTGVFKVTE